MKNTLKNLLKEYEKLNDNSMIAIPYKEHRARDSKTTLEFYEWIKYTAISTYDVPDRYKHDADYEMEINSEIYGLLHKVTNVWELNIDDDAVEYIKGIMPEVNPYLGQELTEIARKIFGLLGINKHPDYEKEFTKWVDALTPRDFDSAFCMMSLGNSWTSCHN